MTCVTITPLGKVDDRHKKRFEEAKNIKDYLLLKAKIQYLLATTEAKVRFEDGKPVQLTLRERHVEDLVAFISEKDVDYSRAAYTIYCDPYNTTSLVEDGRIGDGFIIRAGGALYDTPKDNLRLLRSMKAGARIEGVYRKGGEPSAAMQDRVFLGRCGPQHPKLEEMLRPFASAGKKAVKLHVISFNVRGGKITVDNTRKPKTARMPQT